MAEKIEVITTNRLVPSDTINIKKLIGLRVVSKNGIVIGKVKQVRINYNYSLEALVVKKNLFSKKVYIGIGYIEKLSEEGIILKIDPFYVFYGNKVINYDGKKIGHVDSIKRKGNTNEIESFVVKSFFRKFFNIDVVNVKYSGKSIILKQGYNVTKKSNG